MKRQVRQGMFETNSSSVHSICISKKPVTQFPQAVYIHSAEYGWDFDCVDDTPSYLYAAIQECSDAYQRQYYMDRLQTVLDEHGVELKGLDSRELKYSGIDHGYELGRFLADLFADEDKLLRFLFSPESCVYTGNDNGCDDDNPMCYCADPETCVEDEKTGEWKDIDNPNHHPDEFDYYMKGN